MANGKTKEEPTTEVSIELLESDLKDLKQLYENEMKQNQKLIKQNQELEANLIIKQAIINENFNESKEEIENLKNRISALNTQKIVLETKLEYEDALTCELREITFTLIDKI